MPRKQTESGKHSGVSHYRTFVTVIGKNLVLPPVFLLLLASTWANCHSLFLPEEKLTVGDSAPSLSSRAGQAPRDSIGGGRRV